jgi:hypothetical protein
MCRDECLGPDEEIERCLITDCSSKSFIKSLGSLPLVTFIFSPISLHPKGALVTNSNPPPVIISNVIY